MPENVTAGGRTADWLNCAESCLRFTSVVEAREFWAGLSLARAILKLTIGVVFLFLDCYEFQNVLRKLEYSDVYLAEMVRDTERPYFSWQGCSWGLPRGAAGACQSCHLTRRQYCPHLINTKVGMLNWEDPGMCLFHPRMLIIQLHILVCSL